MMSTKQINRKKKIKRNQTPLQWIFSVLIGFALCIIGLPFNAHAEGDSGLEVPPTGCTVRITLTYGGQEDTSIYQTAYLMRTDIVGERYSLADVNSGICTLSPGDYTIYISDAETGQDIAIHGTKITVEENVPLSCTINYFCIRFIDFDGISLLSKQYVAENGMLIEPPISPRPDYNWLGWSATANGEIINLPVNVTSDNTFYEVWEEKIHIHTFDEGTVVTEATETAEGEKRYTCTVCGYSESETIPKLPHTHDYSTDWKSDGTSHWHECRCGGKTETAPHTAGEWIIDEQPTVSAVGSRHKECSVCKSLLVTETVEKLVPPTITAGIGQIFHPGSRMGLAITCSASLDDLTGVYVDNAPVHKDNYTAASKASENDVLTLHPAYLENLAGGDHTITLAYKNGTSAETQFTVQKTRAVKTGDNENYIPLVILLILSGCVTAVTTLIRKKDFKG